MDLTGQTPAELFAASFEGDYDDEAPWNAVSELRRRGTREVFDLAEAYSQSTEAVHRARAIAVLAQLGHSRLTPVGPFHEERIDIALRGLKDESPLVVNASAWALAHLGGDLSVSALIDLRHHSDPDVRWAVANGLAGTNREDSIQTLLELMNDPDDEVRNWATFGLGSLYISDHPDSPEIREAFRKRLDDSFRDVREEAVWALARRRDRQGLQLLIDHLSTSGHWAGDEMAAGDILDLHSDAPVADLINGLQKVLDALPLS